eukprot:TRINITY_DN76259_c0_g1_i1.p1 TRINITY_DN76259_c0_g1~~TRINITY_DN76259_c0_g1_i1.p1  ORF type:complete len:187 (+),score=39.14 TRINITY_DN76259_c0_g1_i1:69-629(+)
MLRALHAAICVASVTAVRLGADADPAPGPYPASASPAQQLGGIASLQGPQGLSTAGGLNSPTLTGEIPSFVGDPNAPVDPAVPKDPIDSPPAPCLQQATSDPVMDLFWKTTRMEAQVERILSKLTDDDQTERKAAKQSSESDSGDKKDKKPDETKTTAGKERSSLMDADSDETADAQTDALEHEGE